MKIGVVIPAYNEAKDISKCLDSLLNQQLAFSTIAVVDNNSTDGLKKMLSDRYGRKVSYLSESRQGVIFARSTGMNSLQPKCDILARVDADTILPPEWTTILKEYFENNPHISAVSGPVDFYDAHLNSQLKWLFNWFSNDLNILAGHSTLTGSNMAVRAKVWKELFPFFSHRKNIHEDTNIALTLEKHGYKVGHHKNLIAECSSRRYETSIFNQINYLTLWPRTYADNGNYVIAGIGFSLIPMAIMFGTIPAWIAAHTYDKKSGDFLLRNLLKKRKGNFNRGNP